MKILEGANISAFWEYFVLKIEREHNFDRISYQTPKDKIQDVKEQCQKWIEQMKLIFTHNSIIKCPMFPLVGIKMKLKRSQIITRKQCFKRGLNVIKTDHNCGMSTIIKASSSTITNCATLLEFLSKVKEMKSKIANCRCASSDVVTSTLNNDINEFNISVRAVLQHFKLNHVYEE